MKLLLQTDSEKEKSAWIQNTKIHQPALKTPTPEFLQKIHMKSTSSPWAITVMTTEQTLTHNFPLTQLTPKLQTQLCSCTLIGTKLSCTSNTESVMIIVSFMSFASITLENCITEKICSWNRESLSKSCEFCKRNTSSVTNNSNSQTSSKPPSKQSTSKTQKTSASQPSTKNA